MDFSDLLSVASVVAYAALLIGGIFVIYRLAAGGWNPATAVPAGWALCPGSLIGGMLVASAVTPDWNPFTMFALWVPFFAIGAWAFYYSLFTQRGLDQATASRRALLWSVPSLLLAPVVAVAMLVLTAL